MTVLVASFAVTNAVPSVYAARINPGN